MDFSCTIKNYPKDSLTRTMSPAISHLLFGFLGYKTVAVLLKTSTHWAAQNNKRQYEGLPERCSLIAFTYVQQLSNTLFTDQEYRKLKHLENRERMRIFPCKLIREMSLQFGLEPREHHDVRNLSADLPALKKVHVPFLEGNLQALSIEIMHLSHLVSLTWNALNTPLPNLQSLTGLTHLNVAGSLFCNEDALQLTPLTALKMLDLSNVRIDDRCFHHLTSLTNLRSLTLSSCDLSGNGLSHLSHLPTLCHISLDYCKNLTEVGLAGLNSLTQLKILNLSHSSINDTGLPYVRSLTHLTTLNLSGCALSDAGLMHLSSLKALTHLDLSFCSQLTGKCLAHFKALAKLKSLCLEECAFKAQRVKK